MPDVRLRRINRVLAHSNRIVGACPNCGTLTTLQPATVRDVWRGTCVYCVIDLEAQGSAVRSTLEAKGVVPTVDSGLYRVRLILLRLWRKSFPCKRATG